MPVIVLKNVTKRWGNFYAVDKLNLTIDNNSFVTLLGPSGCGKTTTLRMIAGLESPTEGLITIDGVPVFDSENGINIPPNKRKVGFLFQNYALWPNMTVYQNISFGLKNIKETFPIYEFSIKNNERIIQILKNPQEYLKALSETKEKDGKINKNSAFIKIIDKFEISKFTAEQLLSYKLELSSTLQDDIKAISEKLAEINTQQRQKYADKGFQLNALYQICKDGQPVTKVRRLSSEEIDLRVRKVSRIVKVGMFMGRYPNELSGGQQQRVAIARTLAPEPSVLFMDEPLSNLDAKLRLEMRSELQRLHIDTNSTFIYVTHDQLEAMTLATKICLLENGLLQQYDAPLTVYENPKNIFVADFVGNPSINFTKAHGKFIGGNFELKIWDNFNIRFVPSEKIDYPKWYENEAITHKAETNLDHYRVEKVNKDRPFEYHIPKLEEDLGYSEDKVYTKDDFVVGIRPEFIKIHETGQYDAVVYSSMPTGMETTVRLQIGNHIITGVSFGNATFEIGAKVKFDIDTNRIILFSEATQQMISRGHVETR